MSEVIKLPPQQLPLSKKNHKWRKAHLDWADDKAYFNCSLTRKSVMHKKINYDLLNGKLHMQDLTMILNPASTKASYIPEEIEHYPIINSKLNVLRGEEAKRVFDFKVVVTNPNSISDIENQKKQELMMLLQQNIEQYSQDEEQLNAEMEKLNDFFTYEWQDIREIRANALLNHYNKEYDMPLLFNNGFMDALTVGEEIYQCDIVGGEPVVERLNPLKVRIFKSGYSSKIEDADIIIIEDYWSPGRIIDTYGEKYFKAKDYKYIEELPDTLGQAHTDGMGNIDERAGFIAKGMVDDEFTFGNSNEFYFDPFNSYDMMGDSLLPYDMAGNIRVLRMYWKSRRKIKKVKSYDPVTGEEIYNFYPEDYVIDESLGEEETIFYINQAWEGTKIGSDIYVNMGPRPIQYNRLSNPSRCHFGIIGSIYCLNENKPFSLVDMMKRYSYLYDVIHDRLNKVLANNWGKIIEIDFAKIPKGWDMEKWMYYAKTYNIAVVDSFKEGNTGAALGKISGAMNNNSRGVIDAEFGASIQQMINLLEFIKLEMAEVAGITRQREGQVSNRETVGGVERATIQSAHITEWLFFTHDNVKKRVYECLLETAKIAMKGRSKKFQYLLPDNLLKVVDIDGDEFAECDYGLVVDNGHATQQLNQKLDMLAQAALQNQALSFSSIMKLYNSCSLAEKERMIEKAERDMQERQSQEQQQQMEMQQQQMQMQSQMKEAEMQQKDMLNQRDNETKIKIAEINSRAEAQRFAMMYDDNEVALEKDKNELLERMREFDEKLKLEREKFEFEQNKHDLEEKRFGLEEKKHADDVELKKKALNKKTTKS